MASKKSQHFFFRFCGNNYIILFPEYQNSGERQLKEMSGGSGGFGTGNRDGLRLSLETYNAPSTSGPSNSSGMFGGITASSPAGVPTLTTPTLTPTTLKNIEQMFLDHDDVPSNQLHHENAARFVPPPIESGLKEETDGANDVTTPVVNDLSTPTIANVILDMSVNDDMLNKPTTVENVVRQLQEDTKPAAAAAAATTTILTVPNVVITNSSPAPPVIKMKRPTSLSLTSSSSKKPRKSLQSVINQLSPSMSKTTTLFTNVPSTSSQLFPAVKPQIVLPTEPTPLHSLATVSAIQHPLPVIQDAKEPVNLTVAKEPPPRNNIQLLLNAASQKSESEDEKPNTSKRKRLRKVIEEEAADDGVDLATLTDDERKKYMRRQRNKEAAARCRQRRLDQTLCLEDQVKDWEAKSESIRQEIEELTTQQAELIVLLQEHSKKCNKCGQQKQAATKD